jgi:uncharacterized protein (TIGR02145 family)
MKKTSNILISSFIVMSFLFLTIGCKKEEEPEPTPEPTPAATTVTDIDGNVYHTVVIGTQTWMVENLKVTHYRNGDPILHLTDFTQWDNIATGAWINYDNQGTNGEVYGHLYNWYALVDGPLIAPAGWHVPTNDEWQTLSDYLGGSPLAGAKIRETGTAHWQAPNTGATNESGFTALPAGACNDAGFSGLGIACSFWTSTESSPDKAFFWNTDNILGTLNHASHFKYFGFSVRCIKD